MKIQPVDIKKIKERKGNPNKMSKAKMEALKFSIEKHGELQPILLDENYVLIDGHQRKKVYEELGKLQIPAIVLPNKTEEDKLIISQIMNKVKGIHDIELDVEEYKRILEKIELEDFSKMTGESEKEIQRLIDRIDKEGKEALDKAESAQKSSKIVHTCPKCGTKFKSPD
jgi:ParB-like chromosome segregation protein Spo0J